MNDAELAILSIFRHFDTSGGEMLMFASFMSRIDDYQITSQQLQESLASLIQKGLVEQKEQSPQSAFFLTAAGYQASLNA